MGNGDATLRFSTNDLPEGDRVAGWRDIVGRKVLRFDVEPLADVPFSFQMAASTLPGLRVISVSMSPIRTERTRALLADGDDSFCILQMLSAAGVFEGLGREVPVGPREAIVMPRGDVASFAFPSESQVLAMHVPREALGPMLRDRDAVLMRPISAQSEALQLLGHFVSGMADGPAMSQELQRVVVSYVYDLLALALGATRDAAEVAGRGGLRAARLRAIKDDICANLHRADLSIGVLAKRHRVTPRYVQMLFESAGTSFSQFLRDERLALAHRMLRSGRCAELPIGTIAYEAGFSDLSNFNHAFRSAYGMTPSDVRAGRSSGKR
jgi:AraC-like DNA-binding protein